MYEFLCRTKKRLDVFIIVSAAVYMAALNSYVKNPGSSGRYGIIGALALFMLFWLVTALRVSAGYGFFGKKECKDLVPLNGDQGHKLHEDMRMAKVWMVPCLVLAWIVFNYCTSGEGIFYGTLLACAMALCINTWAFGKRYAMFEANFTGGLDSRNDPEWKRARRSRAAAFLYMNRCLVLGLLGAVFMGVTSLVKRYTMLPLSILYLRCVIGLFYAPLMLFLGFFDLFNRNK